MTRFEQGNFHAVSLQNNFAKHMNHVPYEWRGPVVDVVDTFEAVQLGLRALGIEDHLVLVEAVKLVIERRDKSELAISND
jgi:hypothetical protein